MYKEIAYTKSKVAGYCWATVIAIESATGENRVVIQELGMNLHRLSEKLNCSINELTHFRSAKILPKPQFKDGVHVYWGITQLPDIKQAISKPLKLNNETKKGASVCKLAKILNSDRTTVAHHIKTGFFPEPNRIKPNYFCFSPEQVEECKKLWAKKEKINSSLIQLGAGLKRLGVTPNELQWIYYHKCQPEDKPVILNNTQRGRFYTMPQIKRFLQKVRTQRKQLGLN